MKLDIFPRVGALCVALFMGLTLVGCGGGGGGDGDDNDAPNPNPPDQNFAPGSISGQMLTLDPGDGNPRQITFTSDTTWMETRDGSDTGGSYEYRRGDSGSTADILLTGSGNNVGLTLVFGSSNAGTFTYTSGENGQGNFTLQTAQNNPDPGPGGGGNDGLAPDSLSGLTMYGTRTFTSTGPVGQTHVYTFSSNGFHDSDPPEESDGVYTYNPDGDHATLTLAYYAPEDFNGDRHEMQMTFRTESTGNFESLYTRRDGTVIRINGTFELR